MNNKQKIKIAEENKDIPTEEVKQDILDTEREIAEMTIEAEHLEKTPLSLQSARLDHMRASARRSGIKERQAFIEKLKVILEVRSLTN
ncbi:hypothetical protein M0R04_13325 [Candidatus Dojkabacteria bacterium]|jgi:hypothetical protein|nr:hypothetical protein [Candidatus Dojkabacteria bacterium]